MTTEEHLAAVEDAIRLAGGPDRVRFCPVSMRESGLVDIHLTELEKP